MVRGDYGGKFTCDVFINIGYRHRIKQKLTAADGAAVGGVDNMRRAHLGM